MPSDTALKTNRRAQPSLLFLQHGSIFEGFGGVEYYLDDLVTASSKICGHERVRTIIPISRPSGVQRGYQAEWVMRPRNRFLRKLQNRIPLAVYRRACRLIAQSRPDLLVASHVSFGPLAHALSRRFHIPYATVVYGIECWGDLMPQDEFALRNSSAIWSISRWTRDVLVRRGFSPQTISILHPRLAAGLENARPAPFRESGPLTLLTVSRLDAREQYKGHDHVLEALRRLSHSMPRLAVRYLIQGDGTDRARLEDAVKTMGLSSKVEFRASVKDRAELESLYREADVFIMPSRFGRWEGRWRGEGFGIVHVEAAAFGIPSIAYACGGVMDIIEHGKDGWLVAPDDVEGLSQAIARFHDDLPLRKRLAETAYQSIPKRFSAAATEAEVAAALDRILPESAG